MLRPPFYQGKLCDSNLSYEYTPRELLDWNLKKVGDELKKVGVRIDIHTEFVLVLQISGVAISIYPSGKILIKNVNVERDAQTIFLDVLHALNQCPSAR
ncbi:MAG: hypothetical protein AABY11_00080 [archaeon]